MDLSALTSIADIVASLGVVATLIYIAREFRHNAERSRLDSMAKAIETQVRQFAHLADEPEKAEILRRALVDFDGLTQGEKGLISPVFHEILISHNVIRHAYASGLLRLASSRCCSTTGRL